MMSIFFSSVYCTIWYFVISVSDKSILYVTFGWRSDGWGPQGMMTNAITAVDELALMKNLNRFAIN